MPAPESRDKAIDTAAALFARQGFVATGVSQVIEESGTPKGSFYFNFPGGKEELGVESLNLAGGRLAGAISQLAASQDSPAGFLEALVTALAGGLEATGYEQGCPIATVALETATTSEPMRLAAETQFKEWEQAIATGLAGGRKPAKKHREFAATVLVMLEGGLLMAKVQQDTGPLESLKPVFRQLLRG